jgi:DNA end-binding protein Ku
VALAAKDKLMGARTRSKAKRSKPNNPQSRKLEGPKLRAGWRGVLRFGLVSIPVQAFNAHLPDKEGVAFHQLHATCHSRIHYQKFCPIHGQVSNDEIVSGYEYAKGKYVVVDPEELEELRPEKDRALNIDAFISPEELDPIYFDGRMYFLAPDGREGAQPYAVLMHAMERQERWGIGQVVFGGRQVLVVVRPDKGALQMAFLHHAEAIQNASSLVRDLPRLAPGDKMAQLAEELIENWTDEKFDFSRYVDRYGEELHKLIEAKIQGRAVVAPEEKEEEPAVYNLMDALRKSMEHNRGAGKSEGNGKHPHRAGRSQTPGRRHRHAS